MEDVDVPFSDEDMSNNGSDEMSDGEENEDMNMRDSGVLRAILESGEENFEKQQAQSLSHQQKELLELLRINEESRPKPEGSCTECEDQKAILHCLQCSDSYCQICFDGLHRKGNRTKHQTKQIQIQDTKKTSDKEVKTQEQAEHHEIHHSDFFSGSMVEEGVEYEFLERAKYIPLRLKFKERKLLRLLEGSLKSSHYTDKVDQLNFKNKARRTYTQLVEICATLSGLIVAADYERGQEVVQTRIFKEFEPFFQRFFEIGRRHKIMNPEKMRSEYGKLMYILQDSVHPEVQELLEFNCFKPICTVYEYLREHNALDLLKEEQMEIATRAIADHTLDGRRKTRAEVRHEVNRKESAVKYLSSKYRHLVPKDDLQRCLYSIGDNNSFLLGTRDPVEKMIRYLKKFFHPDRVEEGYSLAIQGGLDGARLTHAHDRQYYYCLQSLTLWKEVTTSMFKLWYQADQDLLSADLNYTLKDTGQGINRVQPSPRIENTMRQILHSVQTEVGRDNWVGSSVIHLGDHNVPNALMFIDKYTQISWILNPIVLVLERIDELAEDERIGYFIQQLYGGCEKLKKDILVDFFRYGFDGSGADNFFDAGSCIDGRLTSAWNWCSKLHDKPFYPIFKLTGFRGFDGY